MGRINLRISDTNKDMIESAAAAAELSTTDFILRHTIQAAREEMAPANRLYTPACQNIMHFPS